MSGKQAKRLRQQQRAAGIEPHLDAKRRRAAEAAASLKNRRAAEERFRLDYPEEYARQQLAQRGELARAMRLMSAVLGVVGKNA